MFPKRFGRRRSGNGRRFRAVRLPKAHHVVQNTEMSQERPSFEPALTPSAGNKWCPDFVDGRPARPSRSSTASTPESLTDRDFHARSDRRRSSVKASHNRASYDGPFSSIIAIGSSDQPSHNFVVASLTSAVRNGSQHLLLVNKSIELPIREPMVLR
jgi:hypothetical protein